MNALASPQEFSQGSFTLKSRGATANDFRFMMESRNETAIRQFMPARGELSLYFSMHAGDSKTLVSEALVRFDRGTAQLLNLYVPEELQRQGYATQTVRAIERYAVDKMKTKSIWVLSPTWEGAQFYRHLQYKEIDSIEMDPDSYGTPQQAVFFKKKLTPEFNIKNSPIREWMRTISASLKIPYFSRKNPTPDIK